MEDKDRLEKLKEEAINNPLKKKKGCKDCKKKNPVEQLPELETIPNIPTKVEIKRAYDELTSYGGVKPEKRDMIQQIYKYIFDEEFDFDCPGCASKQARKFHNYISKNKI